MIENTNSQREIIQNLLHDLGMREHLRGYHFLSEALLLTSTSSQNVYEICMGKLFQEVAQKYSSTASRVERDIRYAITTTWNNGNYAFQEELFGYTVHSDSGKPSNREFIILITNRLRRKNDK